jgi:hypothetical protein
MEAMLITQGVSPWRSFDEIEDHLTLDEMMLLHDVMAKGKQMHYRMLASFQGIDIGEMYGDSFAGGDDGDLPQELLEAERAWKEKKEKALAEGEKEKAELEPFGLGYSKA